MADTKTTDETLAGPLDGTEVTRIVQGGVNKKAPFVLSRVRVALSSAQLLALFTSPVEIVPAPGAGKYIQIISATYSLTFATAQYTTSGDNTVGLYYGNGADDNQADAPNGVASAVFQNASNTVGLTLGQLNSATGYYSDLSVIVNRPLNLSSQVSDMTVGDGTGSVTVLYATITL